jgi:hypothetical protein
MITTIQKKQLIPGRDPVRLTDKNTYSWPTPVGRHLMKITHLYKAIDPNNNNKTEMVFKLRSYAPNHEGKYYTIERKYGWDKYGKASISWAILALSDQLFEPIDLDRIIKDRSLVGLNIIADIDVSDDGETHIMRWRRIVPPHDNVVYRHDLTEEEIESIFHCDSWWENELQLIARDEKEMAENAICN